MKHEIPKIDEESDYEFPIPLEWNDFNKIQFPEARWRIKDHIPYEGFVIIAAPAGEKKSWIAMEMAKSITTGKDFLNEFPVLQGNVLYINGEMSQGLFQRRGRQLGYESISNEYKIWIVNQGINFQLELFQNWLNAFVVSFKISTVIIDTLRAVNGGLDENDAAKVREFYDLFKPYKEKGVSVIFLDHCRKPSYQEGKLPKKEQLFGSNDKVNSVEILLMLRSEPGSQEVNVFQTKNRLGMEIKPYSILMHDEGDSLTPIVSFSFEGEFKEREIKKEQAKEFILEFLKDGSKKSVLDLKKSVREAVNVAGRNVDDAIKELVKTKELDRVRIGTPYYYFLPSIITV